MTNRERLRAMSGMELANWILGMVEDDGFCTGCPAIGICRLNWQNAACVATIANWLEMEADNGTGD